MPKKSKASQEPRPLSVASTDHLTKAELQSRDDAERAMLELEKLPVDTRWELTPDGKAKTDALEDAEPAEERLRLRVIDSIKYFMKQRELSQSDMARTSGLSVSVINRILKGKRRANTEQISAIAEALEVDPSRLFETSAQIAIIEKLEDEGIDPHDPSTSSRVNPGRPIPPSLREFLRQFGEKITPEERRVVVSIGRSMHGIKDMKPGFWLGVVRLFRESASSWT